MNLVVTIIVVLLILAVLGAPGLAFTHNYGYYPSGGLGLIVLILLILLLAGKL